MPQRYAHRISSALTASALPSSMLTVIMIGRFATRAVTVKQYKFVWRISVRTNKNYLLYSQRIKKVINDYLIFTLLFLFTFATTHWTYQEINLWLLEISST
jgi:multidrug efflux pump subunit AcrB